MDTVYRRAKPRAVAGQNGPEIGELRVPTVALYQLGDAQPAVSIAPGTSDLQHYQLTRDVAQRDRAAAAHSSSAVYRDVRRQLAAAAERNSAPAGLFP